MPHQLHHVSVQTTQGAQLHEFLSRIAGLPFTQELHVPGRAVGELLGWPGGVSTTARLYGEPPGMLEVIDIPQRMGATVPTGLAMLTIAVRDIDQALATCRDADLTTSSVLDLSAELGLLAARVEVEGLFFELVEYIRHP